ncbi:hypothetical protein M3223_05750 [Paenibacillus pasadenensis]|uniref:hypothetical protein n=1 Tax=Paenibacillus pasadenensis TaxID=217090 RepID=UPI002041D1FD|nr:hypothetical protein [Paenibacillus pasadenensis]MCM3746857.1 hypothetical protein [Paenibacillus pasadenensis]
MNDGEVQISTQSNLGVILVLFILLVIVTKVFYFRPDEDGETSINSTLTFEIYNGSTFASPAYRLRFYTRTGQIPLPSRYIYPFFSEFITFQFDGYEQKVATITYRVYDDYDRSTPPVILGEITFQLEGVPGFGLIRVLRNTSPVRALVFPPNRVAVHPPAEYRQ